MSLQTDARAALLAASNDLEAIRPAAEKAIGGSDTRDAPIEAAWELARERFRAACAEWVRVTRG